MRKSGITVAASAMGIALMLAQVGCSSSGSSQNATASAASCKGQPVNVMSISTLSGGTAEHPEIPDAVVAAAQQINSACELGRPVKVTVCDDQYNPNASENCAREAVSMHAVAVVGQDGDLAEDALPILKAAGIPEVGFYQNGSNAASLPNSFPLDWGLTLVEGEVATAASLGAKKAAIVAINSPGTSFLVSLSKVALQSLGASLVKTILVSPSATDMSAPAAQLQASGAQVYIPFLAESALLQLLDSLHQQGDTHPVMGSALTVTPTLIKQWGSVTNGLYIIGGSAPITDTSNTGIQEMLKELQAAGKNPAQQSDFGIAAWTGMHVVANLLKGQKPMTAATLMNLLNSAGKMSPPQIAPFDFSKHAFADNPAFAKLRIFSNEVSVSRVENGTPVVVSGGFVPVTGKFALTTAG